MTLLGTAEGLLGLADLLTTIAKFLPARQGNHHYRKRPPGSSVISVTQMV